ncbi:hypothetical protein FJZ36_09720 [Candidatus Poribacteria bacterium]|nr:hypothetical protein [Candidatus Poribacteria bacterium]
MANRVALVARREYLENLGTKGFWLGLLVFPVILIASIAVPFLFSKSAGRRTYTVIDGSGWLGAAVQERILTQEFTTLLRATIRIEESGDSSAYALPDSMVELAVAVKPLSDDHRARVAGALAGSDAAVEALDSALDSYVKELVLSARAEAQSWYRSLTAKQAKRIDDGLDATRYAYVAPPDRPAAVDELNRQIADGRLFAYFVIGPDPVTGSDGTRYVSKNLTDTSLRDWYAWRASEVVRERRIERQGLTSEIAGWLSAPLSFVGEVVGSGGATSAAKASDKLRQWAPAIFVYILWVSVFSSAQMLLMNTVEEKSNRVLEVLLSSVSSLELMSGKILGMAATGLTIVGAWVAFFYATTMALPRFFVGMPDLGLAQIASDPVYLLLFLCYYIFGYFLYAALLVAIGSVCSTHKEAQNLMTPIVLALILPLLTLTPITRDPNGTLARILSFIPTFTPFVMMNRSAGPPEVWEYVVTTVELMLSVVVAFWAAGRVFRVGVLMTGKPPSLREIVRWARASGGRRQINAL